MQAAPDAEFNPLARFETGLRLLPLAAGAAGISGVLLNRVLSGVSTARDSRTVRGLRSGSPLEVP